ncbi:telo2 interacting protein 1 [Brevipalpus obovatus]|uniref:telo2 interacting protein 1 n=1 Tax=Brevipalpus obovatus TaxID=246614 RepID=UPI003D9E9AA7
MMLPSLKDWSQGRMAESSIMDNDGGLRDLMEIKHGIGALGDRICGDKQLKDVKIIQRMIQNLDCRLLKVFQREIKQPLRYILANPEECHQTIVLEVIVCVKDLLGKDLFTSDLEEFVFFYSSLFHIVEVKTNDHLGMCLISEDLKLKAVCCARDLLESLSVDMIECLMQRGDLHAMIGHSIHALLQTCVFEKYISLSTDSVNTIHFLLKTLTKVDKVQIDLDEFEVGDFLAYFFPGISIGMMKILTRDDKLPQKLLISALDTLSFLLESTLNVSSVLDEDIEKYHLIKRSEEWLKICLEKLDIVFDRLIPALLSHNSPSVRKRFIAFCESALCIISRLSKFEIPWKLLEVLMILAVDNDLDTSHEADKALNSSVIHSFISQQSNMSNFQDNFYKILTSVTREFQYSSSDEKENKLKLIGGYITCLNSDGMDSFFLSESSKNRLLQCLIDLASFRGKTLVLEKLATGLDSGCVNESKIVDHLPKKQFKFLENHVHESYMQRSCVLLGKFAPSFTLMDYVLGFLVDGQALNPAIFFVINSIIQGVSHKESLHEILNEYTSKLENLTEKEDINYDESLCISLLIEGLTYLAEKFGKEERHSILLPSLYPILANTASEQFVIADTSLIALKRLSVLFTYNSIRELITDNVDYLLDYINVKLKHFQSNTKVCSVIRAMLSFSELEILCFFEFTLKNVLENIDIFYSINCVNLVNILFVTTSFIFNRMLITETLQESSPSFQSEHDGLMNNLKDFLKSRMICQNLDDNLESETKSDAELDHSDHSDEGEKDADKRLPLEIQITKEILERCIHLLSNPIPDVQLKCLDINEKGLRILKLHEDELLPIAHKLWTPIVKRLRSDNLLVLRKSFDCLIIMGACCGDFLKKRTLQENILTELVAFLKQKISQSHGKTDTSPYHFTIEYKIQEGILRRIGSLCYHLKLENDNLWPIIESLISYLSNMQPLSLQTACRESLEHLITIDPYALDFYLENLLASKSEKEVKRYERNVKYLLKKIKSCDT